MLLRPVLLRHCFHSPSPAPPPIYLAPALASPTGPSLVLPQETQLIWINIQIMRSSLMVLASLLLLLVLATTAHGIRLDRHLHEALGNKEQLAGQPQKSNDAADSTGSSKPCTSDGNCSGKAKKPPSPHTHAEPEEASAKHQIPPKRKDGHAQVTSHGEQEEAPLPRQPQQKTWSRRTLPRRPKQQETRTYPDLIDIAGMDYSPAARKPPIHN
ncbi:hypothetical protein VPH35_040575 [Triticum aestivum]